MDNKQLSLLVQLVLKIRFITQFAVGFASLK